MTAPIIVQIAGIFVSVHEQLAVIYTGKNFTRLFNNHCVAVQWPLDQGGQGHVVVYQVTIFTRVVTSCTTGLAFALLFLLLLLLLLLLWRH
jgi:hypothetical protein